MSLTQLSVADQALVRQAIVAILDGPFLADWEFATRLGVSRAEVRAVLAVWPEVDDAPGSDAYLVINNSLNELCHGVPLTDAHWAGWSAEPRAALLAVYRRWARTQGRTSTGIQ
jgi:hypothetical protein